MKIAWTIAIGFLFILHTSCGQEHEKTKTDDKGEHAYTNELIHESSPYLLQHAHNPVNWYPWGDKALKKAKDENKLLIISVGYSACHWCHVMEHESFEDTTVARIMNENFVCIRVDREERPDVDQVYMNAAQLITGRGGWPLNVLALPDGKPFYAGTYFPKDGWIEVLTYFTKMREKDPEAIQTQADKITQGIHSVENVLFKDEEGSFSIHELNLGFENWKQNIDYKKGGGHKAPKFPMPSMWEYLLHYGHISKNNEALRGVTATLDNMAFGGIYDHVGGGFARYSTDVDWHVPHFEKMLYDNAQLVSLYTHAWQQTKDPLYKQVVYETLDFIEREMTSKEGGFYSSLDADSEGEEGKFYVWTKKEIDKVLGENAALFNAYYNVTEFGNWEHGKNILNRKDSHKKIARKYEITVEELQKRLDEAKKSLLKERAKRVRPGLDDKILTSWNALMLKGYSDAYRAFGEERFLKAALKNAEFLVKNAVGKDGAITRNYKDGKSSINGFLDDYAFVISAFIELYEASFDEKWLNKANDLSEYTLAHFYDSTSGMFFYTHADHSNLIARKMEVSDNVIPASNSEMAKNLYFLGHYFNSEAYRNTARQMLINVQADVHKNIYYYSNWAVLEAHFVQQPFEVAIVGKDCIAIRHQLDQHYLPKVLFLGGKTEGTLELLEYKLTKGETIIYVCQNKACQLPVTKVVDALEQLKE
ncbi:MAG: thioredoxin domain-containing protein [Crocinitomicaceae bacterium]|nr:thioredoxin domain-containing protein [Crocinitomicaceae bacterium]